ncbi:MAG: site-specific DNA-methyltransferase [Blautia sp.]|nr:site-specific DNA-methyltransferase [Blautia sp.]MCM1199696.1 site-specific DNA-methyltransferase [Bacteroides fragilis]
MEQQTYEQLSFIKIPINNFLVDNFSAGGLCPDEARKEIEERYSRLLCITDKFNRQNVSYQLSKKEVLHSWLKYKEGFSANLVNILLDEMGAKPGDWIMDPFMGSGTTALVCQMRGINSIGYDIMPISSVSIKAKSAIWKYDINEIRALIRDVEALSIPPHYSECTPYITITKYAYPEKNEKFLHYIAAWRDHSQYSEDAKNLLTLCIINSLEKCSYTSKVGQYLGWDCRAKKVIDANKLRAEKGQKLLPSKYVRNVILDSKETILGELHRVLFDIETVQNGGNDNQNAKIEFIPASVLYKLPELEENFLTGVITSPPYCNRYDYTRTYALELVYLGLGEQEIKDMRQSLLSCTVESHSKIKELKRYYENINQRARFDAIYSTIKKNAAFKEIMFALKERKENGDLNNNGVIRMVEGYFTELAFIYAELYRVCKSGAMVAFVNDNVRYGGEVIPVDFLSSSFAEQFGFKIKKIYSLKQQKGNSSQQMARYGRVALRKSITIWIKE